MILVVDDEPNVADTLVAILKLAGYRCAAAYSATEALAIARVEPPALMISDVVMPGANGVELAVEMHRRWPKVQIVLVSGNAVTQDIVESARGHGYAFELLAKPVPPRQIIAKVVSLLEGA